MFAVRRGIIVGYERLMAVMCAVSHGRSCGPVLLHFAFPRSGLLRVPFLPVCWVLLFLIEPRLPYGPIIRWDWMGWDAPHLGVSLHRRIVTIMSETTNMAYDSGFFSFFLGFVGRGETWVASVQGNSRYSSSDYGSSPLMRLEAKLITVEGCMNLATLRF